MAAIDIISVILSFGVVLSLRCLFPRNIVPLVSNSFDEAMALLERAEAIDISYVGEYRADLEFLRPQFIQMRSENHRSPGFFQQFYLLLLCGLSWRLYDLKSRVDAVRRRIELALDERHPFASIANNSNSNAQSATTTALPAPAADSVVPATNVTEPTPPPQAVLSARPPGHR